jgi:hypothetical protein
MTENGAMSHMKSVRAPVLNFEPPARVKKKKGSTQFYEYFSTIEMDR